MEICNCKCEGGLQIVTLQLKWGLNTYDEM